MPHPTTAPELKLTRLHLKRVEPDGTFEGYASLFDTEDIGHDVIAPGAFREESPDAAPPASRCCSSTTRPSRSACGRP